MTGVGVATVDMCAYGLRPVVVSSPDAPAKKPTRLMTNCPALLYGMTRRCDGRHVHQTLLGHRAAGAAAYPIGFCRRVATCLSVQWCRDEEVMNSVCEIVGEEQDRSHEEVNSDDWRTFVDDKSGLTLDAKLVDKARRGELATLREMGVYKKVPRHVSLEAAALRGAPIIDVWWLDVNKAAPTDPPDVRS